MERLLDEVSFHAPELGGQSLLIDGAYVDRMLEDIARSDDHLHGLLARCQ
jgi:ATP-dependent HslUV protease ATP-binding subunit HslU